MPNLKNSKLIADMLRDMRLTTTVPGWVKIFLLNHGEVKQLMSIFILSPNKRDVRNCTIVIFPHVNKILLRIIKKQLELCIGPETPMEQAGLRKWREAVEQIANVSDSWRAQGSTTKMSICFIDYAKDFDNVQHFKMWNSIRSVEIIKLLTVLIRDLHTE
jgi:hypothetical protein